MWRCFRKLNRCGVFREIFSTYVEVFPLTYDNEHLPPDFLHVCGGVSVYESQAFSLTGFSPRMWRCFLELIDQIARAKIFSTYVEVFLFAWRAGSHCVNFLHVCGGVSLQDSLPVSTGEFSPRMWRCFPKKTGLKRPVKIFSTYVEVFLKQFVFLRDLFDFLHVCGGVSRLHAELLNDLLFSPRMWRCFPVVND